MSQIMTETWEVTLKGAQIKISISVKFESVLQFKYSEDFLLYVCVYVSMFWTSDY